MTEHAGWGGPEETALSCMETISVKAIIVSSGHTGLIPGREPEDGGRERLQIEKQPEDLIKKFAKLSYLQMHYFIF